MPTKLNGRMEHVTRKKPLQFVAHHHKGADPGFFLTLWDRMFFLTFSKISPGIIHVFDEKKSEIFRELLSMSVCNLVGLD